jgi:hypothetical protein
MELLSFTRGCLKAQSPSLLVTPSPVSPSPYRRGRGVNRKRGFAPLIRPVIKEVKLQERLQGVLEGRSPSYLTPLVPLSFEGEGEGD